MGAKQINIEWPALYDKQRQAIFNSARYAIIEASTKTGKTAGCLIWLADLAFQGRSGQNFWWVAPVSTTARMAYTRMKRAIPRDLYTYHDTYLTITLANGPVIWFKSADKPDSLYGEDVYGAVIDEATRCKEDSWYAVRSTLTKTQGPVRIIGNVKGRKNWAYTIARKAESGADGMTYSKLTAYDAVDAGVLALEEVEDAKANLPEHVFRELYLAEPSDDGGNPFGIAAIERVKLEAPSTKPTAYYGVDLAKSVDWTWIIGIDSDGHQTESHRFQKDWGATKETILQIIGNTPALIDSTGNGDPVVEDLQRQRSNVEGFKFTSTSKQQLMEGLAYAIQQERIGYYDAALGNELKAFEYEYTRNGVRYSAPDGLHDDGVCALALAERCRSTPKKFTDSLQPTMISI